MLGSFWTNFYTRSLPENRNWPKLRLKMLLTTWQLVYTVQRGLELMLSGPMAFLALIFSLPDQFLMRRDLEKRVQERSRWWRWGWESPKVECCVDGGEAACRQSEPRSASLCSGWGGESRLAQYQIFYTDFSHLPSVWLQIQGLPHFYPVMRLLGTLNLLQVDLHFPPVAGLHSFLLRFKISLHPPQFTSVTRLKTPPFFTRSKALRSGVTEGLLILPSWWKWWFLHRSWRNMWCSLVTCQCPVHAAYRALPSQWCQSNPLNASLVSSDLCFICLLLVGCLFTPGVSTGSRRIRLWPE